MGEEAPTNHLKQSDSASEQNMVQRPRVGGQYQEGSGAAKGREISAGPVGPQKWHLCSVWPLPPSTDPGAHHSLHAHHPTRPLDHICDRPQLGHTCYRWCLLPRSPTSGQSLSSHRATGTLVVLLTSQVSILRTALWRVSNEVTRGNLIDGAMSIWTF